MRHFAVEFHEFSLQPPSLDGGSRMKELCLISLENLAQKMPNEGLFASE